MYNEIAIIEKIPCSKTKVALLLEFISEYGGWIQHLDAVGAKWGASGEATGAAKEKVKALAHVKELKQMTLSLVA